MKMQHSSRYGLLALSTAAHFRPCFTRCACIDCKEYTYINCGLALSAILHGQYYLRLCIDVDVLDTYAERLTRLNNNNVA